MTPAVQVGLILVYSVLVFFLWRTPVMYPFKLITIYIHEMGHALAGVATGGKFEGIEVFPNEGGVCHLRGGSMWLVLPAGYVGSSFVGALLILFSRSPLLSKVASVLLVIALLFTLRKAKSVLTVAISLGFSAALLLGWWFQKGLLLPYLIAFVGTMSSMYAIYDIYDDTIRRNVPASDASKMAEKLGIPSVLVGVLWFLFSCLLLAGSLYLSLRLGNG